MARVRSVLSALVLGASVSLAVFSTQCRSPTEVTLILTTDTCPKSPTTSITVGTPAMFAGADASSPPLTVTSQCSGQSIGTFVVLPNASSEEPFEVVVVTGVDVPAEQCAANAYKGCIIERRIMSFVDYTPLDLPIEMLSDCEGVVCDPSSTCVNQHCVPAKIGDPGSCTTPGGCDLNEGGALPDGALADRTHPGDGGSGDARDGTMNEGGGPEGSSMDGMTETDPGDTSQDGPCVAKAGCKDAPSDAPKDATNDSRSDGPPKDASMGIDSSMMHGDGGIHVGIDP